MSVIILSVHRMVSINSLFFQFIVVKLSLNHFRGNIFTISLMYSPPLPECHFFSNPAEWHVSLQREHAVNEPTITINPFYISMKMQMLTIQKKFTFICRVLCKRFFYRYFFVALQFRALKKYKTNVNTLAPCEK